MDDPVVFMHGFPDKMISVVVDAVKKAAREAGVDPKTIAFAASTPVNMGWKIRDLIREVRQEHETITKKQESANFPGACCTCRFLCLF